MGEVKGEACRILITGAGGFIGRATVAEARARGLDVVALVRKSVAPEWADDDGVTVVEADLSEPSSQQPLRRALRGCDAVIHAAAHLTTQWAKKVAHKVCRQHMELPRSLPQHMDLPRSLPQNSPPHCSNHIVEVQLLLEEYLQTLWHPFSS